MSTRVRAGVGAANGSRAIRGTTALAGLVLGLLLGAPSARADASSTRVLRLGGEGEAAALEAELALLELQLVDATSDVSADRAGALRLLQTGSAAVLLVEPSPPRLYVLRCGRVRERVLPSGPSSTAALLTAELVVATLRAPCALRRLAYEGGGALSAPVAYGLTLRGEGFEEAPFGGVRAPEPRRPPGDVPDVPPPWHFGLSTGAVFDALGQRASAQVELSATHPIARDGARSLNAGLRVALPLGALRGGDERTTATVHVGAVDLALEGRLQRDRWTLVADAGPALLWARMRVDGAPGPLQPSYPLLGARAVFGGLSAGLGMERWLTSRVGLRMGLRIRHALPAGVTLRRAPQEDDASPQFFRFGTQLGLALGLSFR